MGFKNFRLQKVTVIWVLTVTLGHLGLWSWGLVSRKGEVEWVLVEVGCFVEVPPENIDLIDCDYTSEVGSKNFRL